MRLNKSIFIFFLTSIAFCNDCPEHYITIENECYFEDHIHVLQDFIDLNNILIDIEPQNIGTQGWKDGKLTYLYLGNHYVTTIPDSIGNLVGIKILDLSRNKISLLPEGICNLYPNHREINLTNNQICPPYPFCFEYVSHQETDQCKSFDCPENYIKIENECYNKNHVNVLDSIIQQNPSLSGLTPLELGQDLGYQFWENGQLIALNLVNNGLTVIPEEICTVYHELEAFDVSNNNICPPYPTCLEYIGKQNIENCEDTPSYQTENIVNNHTIFSKMKNNTGIDIAKFQNDMSVLQAIIDVNDSLKGKQPLEIGLQKWENMRLVSLNLSGSGLTKLPSSICDIYPGLSAFDATNNSICPPYPACIENLSGQDFSTCEDYDCPENYAKIDDECYLEAHLKILNDLIQNNDIFNGLKPLEITKKNGTQKWLNGRLNQLILSGNHLTQLPESICDVYSQLSAFDISNNSICPPYPDCIKDIGFQDISSCFQSTTCLEGYIEYDDQCYYYEDLRILIEFTKLNSEIMHYHPLALGHQTWKDRRLHGLDLSNLEISILPDSIIKLDTLRYLDLSNNKLTSLPEAICNLNGNLIELNLSNNHLCKPYIDCFDYVGHQNLENCPGDKDETDDFCSYGYIEINGQCYHGEDLEVLQSFIENNISLAGRHPLEIGFQKWENMRLDFLYLGMNELTEIPWSICKIHDNLSGINVSGNNICPPYPTCIEDIIEDQDTSNCQ